jgi:hypothetical protein
MMRSPTSANVVPLVAYLMAISLATWGVAHLVGATPTASAPACITSGIRALMTADLLGSGEICAAAAGVRASLNVNQLRPGGSYRTLLVDHLDPQAACATVCAPDPEAGPRALTSRIVRVVDTSNADDSGGLHATQQVIALSPPRGWTVQLVLVELVRGPVPQVTEAGSNAGPHHRADRLPDDDAESAVAEADFHFP